MASDIRVRFKHELSGIYRTLFLLFLQIGVLESLYYQGIPSQYAIFPKWNACVNSSLSFEFRTTSRKTGLLLYADDGGKFDFIQVSLNNGRVNLTLNIVDGRDGNVEIVVGENLYDNRWHKVDIQRKRMETTLTVDGISESKVAIGSDFHFGRLESNSPLYLGGLPLIFIQPRQMKRLSLPSAPLEGKFQGQIINVLYGNCTCQLARGAVMESVGVDREPAEACEVNNPCTPDCLCISTDEGPGCDCSPLRCEPGAITYYLLEMNVLLGDTLVNPSGLDATASGEPRLIRGVSGKALAIDGRRQWLRVSGPGHRFECFGDLDKCPMGYTLMLWVQFSGAGSEKAVYMSNGGHSDNSHGIAMYYANGMLEFVFKRRNGEQWSVEYDNLLSGHWYHLTVTWTRRGGLVLYINGDRVNHNSSPQQKRAVRGNARYNDFFLGRSNDFTGYSGLGTIVVDEFQFWSESKTAKEVRELGPIYKYYLSMDQMEGGHLKTKHLKGSPVGNVALSDDGKVGKALKISGGGDYVDFGHHSDICLGNLEKCLYGFYSSFWIKFNKLDDNTYFVATGPKGFALYYRRGRLYAELTSHEKMWKTYWYRPVTGRWYFIEVSWDNKKSLSLYVDLNREAIHREYNSHRPRETSHHSFYIGRANTPMNEEIFATMEIDEMETFYADRETLIHLGFIQRGKPINHYFNFDRMSGSRIVHPSYVISTYGGARLVGGKIGQALALNGDSQVADIGEHDDNCMGNLDFCRHGAMQAFWLRPGDVKENMYYLSNGRNGFNVWYRGGMLHASAETSTKQWKVSIPMVTEDQWYFIELSWHPERGLQLFSNQKLVRETKVSSSRRAQRRFSFGSQIGHFYIGRGNTDMRSSAYANSTIDELEYWYGDRNYLLAHNFIQRGKPTNYMVDLEEIRNNRLVHPVLNLKAFGNPKIVSGKFGNALRLNGKRQYVDMGEYTDKCLGNLALCQHGFTLAFWVNFQKFENNMYYFSSGSNGVQIYHKDGHLFFTVKQPGKTWQAAISRADWLRAGEWYFVELSWHPEHGLNIYIDNKLAQSIRDPVIRERLSAGSNHLYLGRANLGDSTEGRFEYADAIFDEMEMWYSRREVLLAFDYILRDLIGYETFSMESQHNGVIDHPKFTVTLVNGGRIVPGKVGNAADLNGNRQYINLGDHHDRCMGNLGLCTHGLTISLWLKAKELQDNTFFLSSPSYSLYYKNGRLHSTFNTETQTWSTSTSKLRPNIWELVEMSWHKEKGIVLRVNGEEVGKSVRSTSVQNDMPEDSPVYIGKSVSDIRREKYANVLVDEVEYHYSSIDNLDARGITNRETIRHEIFHTGRSRDGILEHPNRRVIVYGGPNTVEGKHDRAVYLNGRRQYLDLGDDVPCLGDLDRCYRGFTMRFDVKPRRLSDNQYFIGSYPIDVYYKDNRIYTTVRTSTRTYTTSSRGFDQGKWQRVEVSYNPGSGIELYLNGQLAGREGRYVRTTRPTDYSRKTYIGRATTNMIREKYADATIEDVEFWDARREYLADRIPGPGPTLPGASGGPQDVRLRMKKLIHFNGESYVPYNFDRIDPKFYRNVPTEELTFVLATRHPNGLIWYTDNPKRNMHVSLRDGRLVFFLEYAGGLTQSIIFPDRIRLNDGRYHLVQIRRQGRQLTFIVDGREGRTITLPRELEFLSPGEVFVGGTTNTADLTGDMVRKNFNGYLGDFEYEKRDRNLKMNVELFALIGPSRNITVLVPGPNGPIPTLPPIDHTPQPPVITSTRAPYTPRPPTRTAITFKVAASYLRLPTWEVGRGATISFEFKSTEPNGLIMFNGGRPNEAKFFAIEMHDGKLYLVYDFGGITKRHAFSDKIINDGDFHFVRVTVRDSHLELSVDGTQKLVNLPDRRFVKFSLGGPLFVGYVDRADRLPWYVWSQGGYIGCVKNLKVNNDLIDLHRLVREQFPLSVETTCISPSRQCVRRQPCWSGSCHERWNGYYCDCSSTAFTDTNCDKLAPIATLDGQTVINVYYDTTEITHTDDMSLQFKTPLKDALLLETKSKSSNKYIKFYLEDGRVKFDTNMGSEKKVIRFGNELNDNEWHTLHMRRRANYIELWVDQDGHTTDKLPGEDFYTAIDEIELGSAVNVTASGPKTRLGYIGYLRNFYYNNRDLFRELKIDAINIPEPNSPLPPLIFHDVTFRTRSGYATLPSLSARNTMYISFMFKTTASSGLILYNGGRGKKFMGVELNYGKLKYVVSDGRTTYLVPVQTDSLNDNRWHSVLIRRLSTGEHIVTVDGKSGKVYLDSDEPWEFTERLFIGGLPDRKFEEDKIRTSFSSRESFQGCLASLNLNGYVPNLMKDATYDKMVLSKGCMDPGILCGPTSCANFGICVQEFGGYWCNCNMTSYVGTDCTEYGVGYRLNSQNKDGVIVYHFPAGRHPDTNADELAFGFKTLKKNGLLARVGSSIVNDFIEIRLENGHVVALYNTGEKEHRLEQTSRKYDDGLYHVVRFYRNSNNATMFVDSYPGIVSDNTGEVYVFNRQSVIHLGAIQDGSGAVSNNFDGIIAGFYFNGIRALDLARIGGTQVRTYDNVVFVPPPLLLKKFPDIVVVPGNGGDGGTGGGLVIPPTPLPGGGIETGGGTGGGIDGGGGVDGGIIEETVIVPSDVGGVGVAWKPAAGGGGLVVGVHPLGTGGTGGILAPPVASGLATAGAGGGAAGGIFSGARAGAVLGTVLGILAAISSLMWAFYLCKPGWCPCWAPAKLPPASPLDISAPRASSNLAVVQAQSGFKTGTANGGGAQYASYYGASNAQASAGGIRTMSSGSDSYDSATLRATGTFSNKGTVIGTPRAGRRVVDGGWADGQATGGSYSSSTFRQTSSSFSGGQQPIPAPPPPQQYNTIGGSYNSNTMSSSYQYQVQNVRTVDMGQHSGYASAGLPAGAITLQGPAAEEIRVDCCLITSDGRYVVTGSYIGTPHVWDMGNGELVRFMRGDTNGSTDLHLACNDRLLVGDVNAEVDVNEFSNRKGVMNRKLQIWDFQSGRPLEMGGDEYCSALVVMGDGDKVVFGRTNQMGSSTSIVVWDLMGNQMIKEMRYDAPIGNSDHVCYLGLSQNNRYVVAGFRNTIDGQANYVIFDMTLTSYNIVEPSLLMLDAEPEVTVILPRDEAVTGLRNGDLVVWNLRNGRSSRQLLSGAGHHAHGREVKALALSEDNRFLASASADGTLKLWDMTTEKQAYTLTGHADEVWCCVISPDNEIIVSGSRDGTIRLWRLRTGTQMCVFNAQLDIFSVKMSRDKGTIVALADKYGARKLIMLQVVRTKSTRKYSL